MIDCHPGPARKKTEHLLAANEKNVYTIEKNGIKKLIYQSPWYKGGDYAGLVETLAGNSLRNAPFHKSLNSHTTNFYMNEVSLYYLLTFPDAVKSATRPGRKSPA